MRDAKNGTYNGETTFCTVNAYGACPYCDQCGVCHIDDPQRDCEDWRFFWDSWDEWLQCDSVQEDEEEDTYEDWGYNEDEGFDPYAGMYTWDC